MPAFRKIGVQAPPLLFILTAIPRIGSEGGLNPKSFRPIRILKNAPVFVSVVMDLARGLNEVTPGSRQLEQCDAIFQDRILSPMILLLVIAVISSRLRREAAPEGGSGRSAKRSIGLRIHKADTSRHQPVDIRGLCLRMPTHAPDGIIEVITDDQEHVGSIRYHPCFQRQPQADQGQCEKNPCEKDELFHRHLPPVVIFFF